MSLNNGHDVDLTNGRIRITYEAMTLIGIWSIRITGAHRDPRDSGAISEKFIEMDRLFLKSISKWGITTQKNDKIKVALFVRSVDHNWMKALKGSTGDGSDLQVSYNVSTLTQRETRPNKDNPVSSIIARYSDERYTRFRELSVSGVLPDYYLITLFEFTPIPDYLNILRGPQNRIQLSEW